MPQVPATSLHSSFTVWARKATSLSGAALFCAGQFDSSRRDGTCTSSARWLTMIHHVSLGSNDLARARDFYDAVMPLLGLRLLKANDRAAHYGVGEIIFSIQKPVNGKAASPGNGVHVAFPVRTRSMVDAFHSECVKRGGISDGAPGLRPEYDANYYGAFIYDPDGNKIEALTLAAK